MRSAQLISRVEMLVAVVQMGARDHAHSTSTNSAGHAAVPDSAQATPLIHPQGQRARLERPRRRFILSIQQPRGIGKSEANTQQRSPEEEKEAARRIQRFQLHFRRILAASAQQERSARGSVGCVLCHSWPAAAADSSWTVADGAVERVEAAGAQAGPASPCASARARELGRPSSG